MEARQPKSLQRLTKIALFTNILSLIIFFFVYGEMSYIMMGLLITLEIFAGIIAIYNLITKVDIKANRWILFMSFVPWLFYLILLLGFFFSQPF